MGNEKKWTQLKSQDTPSSGIQEPQNADKEIAKCNVDKEDRPLLPLSPHTKPDSGKEENENAFPVWWIRLASHRFHHPPCASSFSFPQSLEPPLCAELYPVNLNTFLDWYQSVLQRNEELTHFLLHVCHTLYALLPPPQQAAVTDFQSSSSASSSLTSLPSTSLLSVVDLLQRGNTMVSSSLGNPPSFPSDSPRSTSTTWRMLLTPLHKTSPTHVSPAPSLPACLKSPEKKEEKHHEREKCDRRQETLVTQGGEVQVRATLSPPVTLEGPSTKGTILNASVVDKTIRPSRLFPRSPTGMTTTHRTNGVIAGRAGGGMVTAAVVSHSPSTGGPAPATTTTGTVILTANRIRTTQPASPFPRVEANHEERPLSSSPHFVLLPTTSSTSVFPTTSTEKNKEEETREPSPDSGKKEQQHTTPSTTTPTLSPSSLLATMVQPLVSGTSKETREEAHSLEHLALIVRDKWAQEVAKDLLWWKEEVCRYRTVMAEIEQELRISQDAYRNLIHLTHKLCSTGADGKGRGKEWKRKEKKEEAETKDTMDSSSSQAVAQQLEEHQTTQEAIKRDPGVEEKNSAVSSSDSSRNQQSSQPIQNQEEEISTSSSFLTGEPISDLSLPGTRAEMDTVPTLSTSRARSSSTALGLQAQKELLPQLLLCLQQNERAVMKGRTMNAALEQLLSLEYEYQRYRASTREQEKEVTLLRQRLQQLEGQIERLSCMQSMENPTSITPPATTSSAITVRGNATHRGSSPSHTGSGVKSTGLPVVAAQPIAAVPLSSPQSSTSIVKEMEAKLKEKEVKLEKEMKEMQQKLDRRNLQVLDKAKQITRLEEVISALQAENRSSGEALHALRRRYEELELEKELSFLETRKAPRLLQQVGKESEGNEKEGTTVVESTCATRQAECSTTIQEGLNDRDMKLLHLQRGFLERKTRFDIEAAQWKNREQIYLCCHRQLSLRALSLTKEVLLLEELAQQQHHAGPRLDEKGREKQPLEGAPHVSPAKEVDTTFTEDAFASSASSLVFLSSRPNKRGGKKGRAHAHQKEAVDTVPTENKKGEMDSGAFHGSSEVALQEVVEEEGSTEGERTAAWMDRRATVTPDAGTPRTREGPHPLQKGHLRDSERTALEEPKNDEEEEEKNPEKGEKEEEEEQENRALQDRIRDIDRRYEADKKKWRMIVHELQRTVTLLSGSATRSSSMIEKGWREGSTIHGMEGGVGEEWIPPTPLSPVSGCFPPPLEHRGGVRTTSMVEEGEGVGTHLFPLPTPPHSLGRERPDPGREERSVPSLHSSGMGLESMYSMSQGIGSDRKGVVAVHTGNRYGGVAGLDARRRGSSCSSSSRTVPNPDIDGDTETNSFLEQKCRWEEERQALCRAVKEAQDKYMIATVELDLLKGAGKGGGGGEKRRGGQGTSSVRGNKPSLPSASSPSASSRRLFHPVTPSSSKGNDSVKGIQLLLEATLLEKIALEERVAKLESEKAQQK